MIVFLYLIILDRVGTKNVDMYQMILNKHRLILHSFPVGFPLLGFKVSICLRGIIFRKSFQEIIMESCFIALQCSFDDELYSHFLILFHTPILSFSEPYFMYLIAPNIYSQPTVIMVLINDLSK